MRIQNTRIHIIDEGYGGVSLKKFEPDFEFCGEKHSKQIESQGVYTCSQKNNTQTQPRSLPPGIPGVKCILLL